MIEIEITGIRKDNGNHYNPHEAIEYYRWVQHGTNRGAITKRDTVVGWLQSGVKAFVHKVEPKVYCFVNTSPSGKRFLQTLPDGAEGNNLLNLPPC